MSAGSRSPSETNRASWLNRFRGLLIRWSKKTENRTAFLQLACAVITWRSIPRHLLPR